MKVPCAKARARRQLANAHYSVKIAIALRALGSLWNSPSAAR
jgi:hypothetical protein